MRAARGALAKVRAKRRVVGVIRWRDMVTAVECVREKEEEEEESEIVDRYWLLPGGTCRITNGTRGRPWARARPLPPHPVHPRRRRRLHAGAASRCTHAATSHFRLPFRSTELDPRLAVSIWRGSI